MLVLVGQSLGYVAYFLGLETVDEADVQQDTRTGITAGVAVRLFQTVVLLVLACLRVMAYLLSEVHACKGTTIISLRCVLHCTFTLFQDLTRLYSDKTFLKKVQMVKVGLDVNSNPTIPTSVSNAKNIGFP